MEMAREFGSATVPVIDINAVSDVDSFRQRMGYFHNV